MTTDALLPCPFCGYSDVFIEPDYADFGTFVARCGHCETASAWKKSKAEAAEQWNTRAAPATPPRINREALVKACHEGMLHYTMEGPAGIARRVEAAILDAATAQPTHKAGCAAVAGVHEDNGAITYGSGECTCAPAQPTPEVTQNELYDALVEPGDYTVEELAATLLRRFHITRKAAP